MVVVIAFILEVILGYFANTTETIEQYKFETGENILLNSGFENEVEGEPANWYKAIIAADNLTLPWDTEEAYKWQQERKYKQHTYL